MLLNYTITKENTMRSNTQILLITILGLTATAGGAGFMRALTRPTQTYQSTTCADLNDLCVGRHGLDSTTIFCGAVESLMDERNADTRPAQCAEAMRLMPLAEKTGPVAASFAFIQKFPADVNRKHHF
jgi:hypothetical protein